MNTITQYDIDLQLNQNLKSMIIHGEHGLVLIKEFVNGLTINKFSNSFSCLFIVLVGLCC